MHFFLLFAFILLHIFFFKYHLCQMIYENHETALLLRLFSK